MSPRIGALAGWTLCAALLAPAPAASDGDEAPRLRFDPFLRPDLGSGGRSATLRPAEPWAPVLHATLVAGAESLANLGGELLSLGDEVNGYRLVEVREWEAVFDHGGEQVTLPITSPAAQR